MCKSKTVNLVKKTTTEERLQLVIEEVIAQNTVINQLIKLVKTTALKRGQNKCNRGHYYCNIDHSINNYVKKSVVLPAAAAFNTRCIRKVLPATRTKFGTDAEEVFIKRLANKVEKVQFDHGVPYPHFKLDI